MNDTSIEKLKRALAEGKLVAWLPGDGPSMVISAIGMAATVKGEEPEPGECAFERGHRKYVNLFNAEARDFVIGERLTED